MPRIIKSNDRREPFDEEKLRAGFHKALEKFTSQIEVEGKAVFSNSSVNAMFLLKLFLEKDTNLRKDFVWSAKLGHIVNVQLKKPLVVSGNDLPAWCNAIFDCAPFLLPVSVRRQWLGCTSLGVSRTIDWYIENVKYLIYRHFYNAKFLMHLKPLNLKGSF